MYRSPSEHPSKTQLSLTYFVSMMSAEAGPAPYKAADPTVARTTAATQEFLMRMNPLMSIHHRQGDWMN